MRQSNLRKIIKKDYKDFHNINLRQNSFYHATLSAVWLKDWITLDIIHDGRGINL